VTAAGRLTAFALCVALSGPASWLSAAEPSNGFRFVDIASTAGLVHPTWCGREEKPHILESNGTGLAVFDYDSDGDLDLYLANGWRLEGSTVTERGINRLYRNEGDGFFRDVTQQAGVGDDGWATAVAVGDVNRDRQPDLLSINFGQDLLYLNSGDGSFSPAENGPSIAGWSTGAVFFDADRDGDEDLYLAAYVDCTLEEVLHAEPELLWEGTRVMLGPFGLEGLDNRYFQNEGEGKFRDATVDAGLEDAGRYYTFGVAALDLDGDRDLDLYAANDSNPNYLYRNDGTGRFQEVGLWSGAALDAMGNAQAGMGLAVGDLQPDGLPDLLVTNFYKDASTLYQNLGDFIFEDVSRNLGVDTPTYPFLSWGATLSDLDLDGDLDLFLVNGHIYPQADEVEKAGTSFRQRNLLLANLGGRFIDASTSAGPGLAVLESSRGLAVGDIDGDGDLDLAVSNVDAPPTLLRNDSTRSGNWLRVDAPAALRVVAETGGRRFERQRVVGASYLSVNDPSFHFGLGDSKLVDRLIVEWPDGQRRAMISLPADHTILARR
jgi:hypothetical protein